MALYEYTGLDAGGGAARGVVEADSPRSARAALKKDGVFATAISEVRREEIRAENATGGFSFRKPISQTELAMLTRQLATLLEAGLPLVDALGSLVDQADAGKARLIVSSVRQRVNEGAQFHEALSDHPAVFTDFYRNMVRAGEAGGTLSLVLARLADFLENQVAFRRKVQAAMAYPILMGVVAVGVLVILMARVVPQITSVFANLGRELPPTTRALLAVSDVFKDYWIFGFALILICVVMVSRYGQTEGGRRHIHQMMLKIPRLGAFTRMAALARFNRTLATLVGAGVPLLDAISVARPVVGNAIIEEAVEKSAILVREGKSLSTALRETGEFPSDMRRMVAVGEESGALDAMLAKVAQGYESRLEALVVSLTSLLEPLMILTMGGLVGFIVYAILRPIFDLTEAIR